MARIVTPPSRADLDAAWNIVRGALAPTPLLASPLLGDGAVVKAESLQPTGAFKVRGALAALSAHPPDTAVVAASAGNHALAIVWAAARLGRSAVIVVPQSVSPAKLAALRHAGADVQLVGASYDEAEAHALALAEQQGKVYVSPYNDSYVIAGQATVGRELDVLDGPLTVVCPIGGGGLAAGLALWAQWRGDVELVGVEPQASHAMSAALRARRLLPIDIGPTLSDGTAGNIEADSVTFEILRGGIDRVVTVSEDELADAIRFLAFEHGLVAEGAGALAVAALRSSAAAPAHRAIALLTGRNITPALLASVLQAA